MLQRRTSLPTSRRCRKAARSWPWAASRTTRRCARYGSGRSAFGFAHGAAPCACPAGALLVDSYHCSRYNTNTRRLTPAMFEAAFDTVAAHLARAAAEAR